ncbi:amidohydrolase family protein [Mesoplasma florum]|uniref:amidohydrolase family protein n=1 Tax=Mesoplasma florum TaxID=2151 RepID=UPI000D03F5DE|nr:amidohydrolase family protein [Mesoplasma florum]AVN58913.1 amidohydrolase/deacetylase family metallohydrolase [Mesoplasma florum]
MKLFKNVKTIDGKFINIFVKNSLIYTSLPKNSVVDEFEEIKIPNDIYVSYGWIDSHVHCDSNNKLYYANIDDIGYKQGVTTIIDCGSVGKENIGQLVEQIKKSKTNTKIILNISKKGIYEQSELKNLNDIDIDVEEKYADYIVGYKARMSASVTLDKGIEPLIKFNKLRNKNNSKPLMVHIGNEPPKLKKILELLNKGDVITHIFNNKNNSVLNKNDEITEEIKLAIKKGIILDLGHGSESFDFNCAKKSFNLDLKLDTISSDIYHENASNGKVKSLANVMSKMRSVGYEWTEIIDKVTKKPAEIFNFEKMGSIRENNFANLTFFKIENSNEIEKDSKNNQIIIKERIIPISCLINGEYCEIQNEKTV